jgi:hypothetical protein
MYITSVIIQSVMALLVIDLTYLQGRDGELVDKELSVADSQTGSHHMCLRSHTLGMKYLHLMLDLIAQ